ncbi:MAG: hotdog domain-containing protein, partial [Acidobacteriota bacterium]
GLETTEAMRADERGLVHGGFVFSLADHAAMLAINRPNCVLGSATSRFLAPVVVGDRLVAEAAVARVDGKKIFVEATVRRGETTVMTAELVCFTPPRHVLQQSGRQK